MVSHSASQRYLSTRGGSYDVRFSRLPHDAPRSIPALRIETRGIAFIRAYAEKIASFLSKMLS